MHLEADTPAAGELGKEPECSKQSHGRNKSEHWEWKRDGGRQSKVTVKTKLVGDGEEGRLQSSKVR